MFYCNSGPSWEENFYICDHIVWTNKQNNQGFFCRVVCLCSPITVYSHGHPLYSSPLFSSISSHQRPCSLDLLEAWRQVSSHHLTIQVQIWLLFCWHCLGTHQSRRACQRFHSLPTVWYPMGVTCLAYIAWCCWIFPWGESFSHSHSCSKSGFIRKSHDVSNWLNNINYAFEPLGH